MTQHASKFEVWFSKGGLKLENGEPQKFFHGTTRDFFEFAPHHGFGKIRPRSLGGNDPKTWGIDCHAFSSCPQVAQSYAFGKASRKAADALVMPVYLRLANPLRFDAKGDYWRHYHEGIVELARKYCKKPIDLSGLSNSNPFEALCINALLGSAAVDGVIIDNVIDVYGGDEYKSTTVFMFEAKSIKSALGNCGQFEEDTYDITL